MITQKIISYNDKELIVNQSDLKSNWIVIHNGKLLLKCEENKNKTGRVETINTIFEADTYQECLVEILSLKLIVEDENIAADLKLLETSTVKKETSFVNPLMLLSAININK